MPEGAARRAARIAQVGARYGFGYVFGRRFLVGRRARDVGRVGTRLRLAMEELGPTFVELGHFLASRGDVLPPDVALELARASAPVPRVTFPEVRALVERELGLSMEKLFVEFDEAPVRVGVLTQAHRVVLPGGRPARVVVSRPGVRRDLLAMRPVADVVRRSLTGRDGRVPPLDPVQAVAEFARYVGQRRDMFSAAQTARRLRELDGFSLGVPEDYRRYSTGRCATFGAPEGGIPPGGTLLTASRELVRLSLTEGIHFADVSPDHFTLAGGELWFADPTEAFALDEERLRGLAEVLAAVRRGDADGVARALPLLGCRVPRDARVLRRELRDVLGALGGPLWREHTLREIRARSLEAMRRGGVVLPTEVAGLLDSLVRAEGLGMPGQEKPGEAAPATVAAAEAAEELIGRFRDPVYIAERTAGRLVQADAYAQYPRQVHSLLEELKDGEIEVVFKHKGLDDLISRVDVFANRLVFALLISALILGSSLLGIFGESGIRLLGIGVFGLVGFVLAAVLGLALLLGIIRSGRL
ncbi:MAG: DNA polymerase IV [uncultured Rubrobacteraceae bacterium]|uniref:DNA polymerase IV n=1 Tax=uncultured Rubrobacteraceae bacterium TaxID=349277 RepID=A0A6J4R7W3_9ACTN|nr:MAG: DNA polymerase IV [uncultured Rubrobacteraceae bacterium]